MSLRDDLRFFLRGTFSQRESAENRLRRLRAQSWQRLVGRGPRVLANSMPKAGTHLLQRALQLLPGIVHSGYFLSHIHHSHRLQDVATFEPRLRRLGRGCFVGAHLPFTEADAARLAAMGYRHVVIIRDPRDVVVSHFHHILGRPTNRWHGDFLRLPDDRTRLTALIDGLPAEAVACRIPLVAIGDELRAYVRWREHGALIVRFEDLIGEHGGGTRAAQLATLRSLDDYLELATPAATLEAIAAELYFPRANTFRKGVIGDWRDHLQPEHERAFKERAGTLLVDLGYEADLDW